MEPITALDYFQGIALRVLLERENQFTLANISAGLINNKAYLEFYEQCRTASLTFAQSMITQP